MTVSGVIEEFLEGKSLDRRRAGELMGLLSSGELPEAAVGGLLIALRAKGPSGEELAGFAGALMERAVRFGAPGSLVDTCGTGGGIPTFNLSTGAAFLAAAAGARVAKHGNRAVTSRCGSADVLEALGVKLDLDQAGQARMLERTGIVFLYAPSHHPTLRNLAAARRALGVRTVFNLVGPLSNPAGADRQLIGVYDRRLLQPMAEALGLLGCRHGLVVCGSDGLDEISPCAPTYCAEVKNGEVSMFELSPNDFGLDALPRSALEPCETAAESAAHLEEALSGKGGAAGTALVPNAAAAVWLYGLASSMGEAADAVKRALAEGRALNKLQEVRKANAIDHP